MMGAIDDELKRKAEEAKIWQEIRLENYRLRAEVASLNEDRDSWRKVAEGLKKSLDATVMDLTQQLATAEEQNALLTLQGQQYREQLNAIGNGWRRQMAQPQEPPAE